MPLGYTALHQFIPAPKWPVGHEIRTHNTGASLLLLGKHYVGPETQHAVEPNAPDASDHHYYALGAPAGEREALLLFAWEDLSYQSVAEALELPIGTVRSRLNRARAQLRELLEPGGKKRMKPR